MQIELAGADEADFQLGASGEIAQSQHRAHDRYRGKQGDDRAQPQILPARRAHVLGGHHDHEAVHALLLNHGPVILFAHPRRATKSRAAAAFAATSRAVRRTHARFRRRSTVSVRLTVEFRRRRRRTVRVRPAPESLQRENDWGISARRLLRQVRAQVHQVHHGHGILSPELRGAQFGLGQKFSG